MSTADAPDRRGARAEDLRSLLGEIAPVEGWLSDAQAERLWQAAARLGPGDRIVEIGSFRGRSTIVLATSAPEGVEVWAIDPHGGTDRGPHEFAGYEAEGQADLEAFRANLVAAGVRDRVRHVRRYSSDALGEVPGPIQLLYIDGAHRFGPARADIRSWSRRVPPGGQMLLHDCFSALGLTLAVVATLFPSAGFRYMGRSGSMAAYRREDLHGVERLRNAARQTMELPWFAYNLVLKAMIRAGLGRWTRVLGHPSGEWPY